MACRNVGRDRASACVIVLAYQGADAPSN